MKNSVCFVDIDGVLANFVNSAIKFHGKEIAYEDIRWEFPTQIGFESVDDPKFWEPLGYHFWYNLPITDECYRVISVVEETFGLDNVALLSSPCLTSGCAEGKIDWIARHLPNYKRRYFLGTAKHVVAHPNAFLVDDNDANCKGFARKGGKAILFPQPWNENRHIQDRIEHLKQSLIKLKKTVQNDSVFTGVCL